MYKKALELGVDYIATGHYAKTEYSEKYKRHVLKKSNSITKDQTYALYSIPKEIVSKVLFPLGNFNNKEDIRKLAKEYDLRVASKPDSQEICFIPDNNYINFLEYQGNINKNEGEILRTNGEILGRHNGLYRYTIGQRKGIHTKSNDRLYVVKLDKEKNRLIVGDEEELLSKELYVKDVNLLLLDEIASPTKVNAKIRYQATPLEATIYPIKNGIMKVEFDAYAKAITPGQAIVFYIDDIVLGGGKIVMNSDVL
jgi:tRNA-specific 2-thiouridylase